ncbi:hypothetical protein [Streptomyces sp. NBC_00280]
MPPGRFHERLRLSLTGGAASDHSTADELEAVVRFLAEMNRELALLSST